VSILHRVYMDRPIPMHAKGHTKDHRLPSTISCLDGAAGVAMPAAASCTATTCAV
jgi:hypothetical protein